MVVDEFAVDFTSALFYHCEHKDGACAVTVAVLIEAEAEAAFLELLPWSWCIYLQRHAWIICVADGTGSDDELNLYFELPAGGRGRGCREIDRVHTYSARYTHSLLTSRHTWGHMSTRIG